jgi:hypothetical protein
MKYLRQGALIWAVLFKMFQYAQTESAYLEPVQVADMFAFPISAYRIQMCMDGLLETYLTRPSVTTQKYRLHSGVYRKVEAELEKDDSFLFQYASESDDWLLDQHSIVTTEEVPASDRVVRIDHNQAQVSEIRALSSSLVDSLETANDLGDLTPDLARAAAAEVRQIEQAFSASYIRPDFIMGVVRRSLRWIADKAGGALVGVAAMALLAAVAAFFGLSP